MNADLPSNRRSHPDRAWLEQIATVIGPPTQSPAFADLLAALRRLVPFDRHIAFGLPYRGVDLESGLVLATDAPADFRDLYCRNRWFERCAYVTALHRADRAVTSADVRRVAAGDAVMKDRLGVTADAVGSAYCGVPVRYDRWARGSIAIRRFHGDFAPQEVAFFELVAPALHAAASDRPGIGVPTPLTEREHECLAWAAEGKTAWGIGAILGISETTVVAHLKAAARKLGAVSRPHAVSEALRRGLID